MRLALAVLALVLAAPAAGGVRVVDGLDVDAAARTGAVGLSVPGAGPEVTRASALATLLTGRVESSLLGGTPPGDPVLVLDGPEPPAIRVVLPPPGRSENDRRYPIAVEGDGATGVLTSDSTRIHGLVSLADVANGTLRWVPVDDPVAVLGALDARIERNDARRVSLLAVALALVLAAALLAPRLAPRVLLLVLAANLWLAGWWVVAPLALLAALLPLGVACGAVVAAYLVVLGLDPEAVALSPFGPSQAGRFYGVSNLLATLLLLPALLGAALLGRLGLVVAGTAAVAVGGARFGADGGGLLVLLAGYAVLVVRLTRVRTTWRRALAVAAALAAAALAFVGLDAALGGSSHVTDALADGPAALAGDLADRLEISLRRTLALGPALVSLASLAALAVVATRRPRGAVTDALLVALAVSLLVNDTPVDVLSVGAVSALAAWRFETAAGARPHGARLDWRRMRRPATFLALLLALVALVAVGCGGEDTTATPETVVGELPEETVEEGNEDLPALDLTGDAAAGESIFASEGCGGCHVLAAAGANGQVGPSLDDGQSYELIVERVTLGQGAMPAFADDLSAQQIADVSQYVADNSSG